jgi:SSS family transporter
VLRPHQDAAMLGVLDWAAIGAYGLVLLIMGLYFMRRERGTEDYFLAGGRIPWWAAGISIFATGLSAITFMAIPAKSYDTDWIYFIQNMGVLIVIPAVVWIFLPFFRRLSVTTAYEYLEYRFNASLRLAGSAIYMLFQVGRVAIVTLLPALALSAVTGFDVTACILVMGGVCIVYTVLGGIEAVIWSDVLQTVILMGGALWALVVMINGIDGGFVAFVDEASASAKFRMADVSFDLTRPTLLVIVLGAIFTSIIPYTSDQSIVQRYLTTKDEKASRRAIWLNGLMAIPASILFFGLGTALWVYYRANPAELEPTDKLDQILPFFIVDQLPAGVAGLVIAAVFAAAMSSLDSSMNSVSAAFTTDWYRRFRPDGGDAHYLRVARVATIGIGVIGTGAAIFMAALEDASLLDVWFKVIGLFGSPLAGLFILGVLSRRAGALAGWCGLLAGVGSVLIASTLTPVSGLIYSVFGIVGCVVVGMVVGAFAPTGRSMDGLTISTMPPAGVEH